MREPDEYKKWHIKESFNYHHILLNQDKVIPELYRFVIINTNSKHSLLEKLIEQNDNPLYA